MKQNFAGFDRRLFAAIFDVTIASIIIVPIVDILNNVILGENQIDDIITRATLENPNTSFTFSLFISKLWEDGFITKYLMIQIISFSIFALYMIAFWVKAGATPGKWIMGCKVLDKSTNTNVSVKQAMLRFLAYVPSTLALCFGFLTIKWHKECQGWHDRFANTVCVQSSGSLNVLKSIFSKVYLRKKTSTK